MRVFLVILIVFTAIAYYASFVRAQQITGNPEIGSSISAINVSSSTVNEYPDKLKSNPAVTVPHVHTSTASQENGACFGGFSLGGSGNYLAAAFGMNFEDKNCTRRYNASHILGLLGEKDLAREELCDIESVYHNAKRVGRPCKYREEYETVAIEDSGVFMQGD